jgi:hypothetical protein
MALASPPFAPRFAKGMEADPSAQIHDRTRSDSFHAGSGFRHRTGNFLFGFLSPRTPRFAGWVGITLNAVHYGTLKFTVPSLVFLDRMAVCAAVLGLITVLKPLAQPATLPCDAQISLVPSAGAKWAGAGVVAATVMLYAVFW